MQLRSAVSLKMAGSGVLSPSEGPRSLLEIQLGDNRHKEDLGFFPRVTPFCQLVCDSESSTLNLKVSQRGQIPTFVLPTIVPLVPYVVVPYLSHLAPKLKSTRRRQQNEAKYCERGRR
jgi:hypothetical protein